MKPTHAEIETKLYQTRNELSQTKEELVKTLDILNKALLEINVGLNGKESLVAAAV